MAKVAELLAGKGRTVIAIGPDEPVLEAIELMAEKGIGAVLVMRGEELPVTTVSPQDSVNTCMMLMSDRKFRHLPVVDDGRVVGVLSIGDLVKAVIEEQQREIAELQRYIAS